jgi:hypothetical protein
VTDRRTYAKAIDPSRSFGRIVKPGDPDLSVLAIHPVYVGESAACIVTATERSGERVLYDVRWLEAKPFTQIAERIRRAISVTSDSIPDLPILAEQTMIGEPGIATLAATIGEWPIRLLASRERESHSPEEGPERISIFDLVGAIQSAQASGRLKSEEEDGLERELKDLRVDGDGYVGHDAPRLRAVSLAIWWLGRSLGDSFAADPRPQADPMLEDLGALERHRQQDGESLGIDWTDDAKGLTIDVDNL